MQKLLAYLSVLAVIAAVYGVVMFAPLILDHFEVKDTCNSTFNSFREFGTAEVTKAELIRRLDTVEWVTHDVQDEFGETKQVKGLGLTDEEVQVDFDERTKVLWLRLHYVRRVVLKPTDKVRVVKFSFERKERPPNIF